MSHDQGFKKWCGDVENVRNWLEILWVCTYASQILIDTVEVL
jgi:hypothetical protein